jgi:hypothetical protein
MSRHHELVVFCFRELGDMRAFAERVSGLIATPRVPDHSSTERLVLCEQTKF